MNYGYNGMLRCLANLNKKQLKTYQNYICIGIFGNNLEYIKIFCLDYTLWGHLEFGVHIIAQYHQEIWCGRHKLDCKRTASKMNYVGSL